MMRWIGLFLLAVGLGAGAWWYLVPPTFELQVTVLDATTGEAPDETGPDVAQFQVRLSKNPRASVTLQLTSSDPEQGTPERSTLTFTEDNWDRPQTVTVLGTDEFLDDGDVSYQVRLFWEDPGTDRKAEAVVDLLGLDDDEKQILIGFLPSSQPDEARLQVSLATQPVTPVELWVRGGESSWKHTGLTGQEDAFRAVASPGVLQFDASNWQIPQVVTLRSRTGSLATTTDAEARQNYDWVIRSRSVQLEWLKVVVLQPHDSGDYRNYSHSVLLNPSRCLRCNRPPAS